MHISFVIISQQANNTFYRNIDLNVLCQLHINTLIKFKRKVIGNSSQINSFHLSQLKLNSIVFVSPES